MTFESEFVTALKYFFCSRSASSPVQAIVYGDETLSRKNANRSSTRSNPGERRQNAYETKGKLQL